MAYADLEVRSREDNQSIKHKSASMKYGSASQSDCKSEKIGRHGLQTRASDGGDEIKYSSSIKSCSSLHPANLIQTSI